MTELSRSEIEWVREDGPSVVTNGAFQTLCDMALRTHDAEERAHRLDEECETHAEDYRQERKRAQRAEAECERLRDALNDHHQWARTHGHEMGLGYLNSWLDIKTRKALVTPPPDSAPLDETVQETPCGICKGSGETNGDECLFCNGTGNASHTPERGDAMEVSAALCRLEAWDDDAYCNSPHARWSDVATARRHLTASGVPYVPESVRRLPERFRKQMHADIAKACGTEMQSKPREVEYAEGFVRELERALATPSQHEQEMENNG